MGRIREKVYSREFIIFLERGTYQLKFVKLSLVPFHCSILLIFSVLLDAPGIVIQITVHKPPLLCSEKLKSLLRLLMRMLRNM